MREEGLASVQGGTLVPMPPLVTDAETEGPPSFAFALPGLLRGLQRRWSEAAAMARPATNEPAPRHADAYGTRQVVVLRGEFSMGQGSYPARAPLQGSNWAYPSA